MKTLLYYLLLILFMWALTGCGSAWKVRRAKKLLESSGVQWKSDTVFQTITDTIPQIEFDTVLRQVNFTDTLIVERNKVITRVKINTVTKEVYVSTKCPERIVTIKVPVVVNKSIEVGDTRWRNFRQYFFGALIGAFLMFVFFIVARALKIIA